MYINVVFVHVYIHVYRYVYRYVCKQWQHRPIDDGLETVSITTIMVTICALL
jgi:hypothetical protein